MIQSDDRAGSAAGEFRRRGLEHELKRCSLDILRRREVIEGLPTFGPLIIAATPLFEVALEIACYVTHGPARRLATATPRSFAGVNERCLEAVGRLSDVFLYLPERRSADFLNFWFESDENDGRLERSANTVPVEDDADNGDADSQWHSDLLLDEVTDLSMVVETGLLEESFQEPADVGGDMNITPQFVHIANRVFDDNEILIARLAVSVN